MKTQQNAASTAVQAELCPKTVMWVPCVLLSSEGQPMHSKRVGEPLASHKDAMSYAEQMLKDYPDAVGVSCVRELVEGEQ